VIAPMRRMYRLVGAFDGLLVEKREGHREKVVKTLLRLIANYGEKFGGVCVCYDKVTLELGVCLFHRWYEINE
jgi:hypothetical protein